MAFDFCVISYTESNLYSNSTSNCAAMTNRNSADENIGRFRLARVGTLHNGGRASKAARGEVIA
jgi:hypothetical protein